MAQKRNTNNEKTVNITVIPSDIRNIGNAKQGCKIDDSGIEYTAFYCNLETANIEEILLRNILSLYDYRIVEVNDFPGPLNADCIQFKTNMPWDEYMQLQ